MARKIEGGYYIKARKIRDSEVAHCAPVVREIWDYLLRECNHTDNPRSGLKRGQIFTTYGDMAEALHWYVGYRKMTYTKTQCERATKVLTKMHMATTTKTTRGIVITVCNYDSYANPKNYEDNTEDFTKTPRRRSTDDTIQENVENKENNELDTNVSVETKVSTVAIDNEMKKEYSLVPKDKKSIAAFIKEKKPAIAEPYCELWNLFASEYGHTQVAKITDDRKKKIKTRIKEPGFDFIEILGKAKNAEVLKEGSWFDLDFIIRNDSNYIKILEGKYDKRLGHSKQPGETTGEVSKATQDMIKSMSNGQ